MFDNLFALAGPVTSAGMLLAVLLAFAVPALRQTCASRGPRLQ